MNNFVIYYRTAFVFLRAAIAVLIFAQALEKRKYYGIRVIASIAAGTFLSYLAMEMKDVYLGWLPLPMTILVAMLIVYMLVNLFTAFCYRGSIWSVLLISASGYAVQDISGHLKSLLLLMPGLEEASVLWHILLDNAMMALTCLPLIFYSDKLCDESQDYLDNRYKGILSVLVLVICIGMGRITGDNTSRNVTAKIAENLYGILISVLLLQLQYSSTARARLSHDVDTMRELLHVQRIQYEANRENVQLVNEKYHDLNKILSSISGRVTQDQIDHLRKEIAAYDTQMKTGSEVLDVILTEKRMVCDAKDILLTCLVDGDVLSFVEDLDLYALFGNLLTNAIEAVEQLPEEQERFIIVTVRNTENMVTIHAANPCQGKLDFSNGLPITQNDPQWHGFGMKSMERIAEKYGGAISALQKDGLFQLDILLFSSKQ